MTNKNINDLTAAATPLAGTELVLVWDGVATKKVTVDNLTAGRAVSIAGLTAAGDTILGDATTDAVTVNGYMGVQSAPVSTQALTLGRATGYNVYASGAAANYFAGNVGVGTTPSAWGASWKALQLGNNFSAIEAENRLYMSVNAHNDGTNWKSKSIGFVGVSTFSYAGGSYSWSSGYSAVAGSTVTLTDRFIIDSSGHILTGTDNAQTLGTAAKRWSVVYAGTGAINTSDAREKTAVSALTPAEINAAKQLSKEIGTYKFLASVQAKGDAARTHIGMTVQRAMEIMESHGLAPFDYGFICHDAWEDQGAGDRYAFRYDQLTLFIVAGIEARLSALEAA